MNVIHKNYQVTRNNLSFEDCGTQLPFGLSEWKHEHVVRPYRNGSIIEDNVTMDRSSLVKRVLIYPIMLFPIFIRRITYKIWFYFLEGKKWSSFKTS
jgi:ligand-binding SRPBCC domain-containing protein